MPWDSPRSQVARGLRLRQQEGGLTARWFFGFFLVSGFCSLVYEVVWLRLAMAQFGVTTPLVSIVLSVFMAGLAVGSWGAGALAQRLQARPAATAIRLYAAAELLIAASGYCVPRELALGRDLLAAKASDAAWGSAAYHLASGCWVTLALLPFCLCMGATMPLAMWAIRRLAPGESALSFSYLYVANVVGAATGTLVSAFVLIELLGFRGTLYVASALNAALAASALSLSLSAPSRASEGSAPGPVEAAAPLLGFSGARILWALFATGLASMAMEVVWVRQFTPYLGNVVYTFASILAIYLVSTFIGSRLYRRWARAQDPARRGALGALPWSVIAVLGVLPLLTADYRLGLPSGIAAALVRVALGVGPFCAALGFLTPWLVDRWSGGDPRRAGGAYALNVVGCIAGPLISGFVLLPLVGERWALFMLALPLLGFALLAVIEAPSPASTRSRAIAVGAGAALSALILVSSRSFESRYPNAMVRRDATGTVTAFGRRMDKSLLVNGVGMTYLTPITKLMAHLPLAVQEKPPDSALTICFGMGTSFRSALSWGIRSTAVELVPSVPSFFPFFHKDAPTLLRSPKARIVIDDGRRFLERSAETYDAIIIDPPPPPEAAGSSLLYSREFYQAARKRLRPAGVLQQWTPAGESRIMASFARTVRESFPYVRVFVSIEDWGYHILASSRPIPWEAASVLASRLPEAAARDLTEWGPAPTAEEQFRLLLVREVPLETVVAAAPGAPVLTDDHPNNEYYFLRRTFGK